MIRPEIHALQLLRWSLLAPPSAAPVVTSVRLRVGWRERWRVRLRRRPLTVYPAGFVRVCRRLGLHAGTVTTDELHDAIIRLLAAARSPFIPPRRRPPPTGIPGPGIPRSG